MHYRYKNQPDGYCMSQEEWVSLWEHDPDDIRVFDETLPGKTPYWIGGFIKSKPDRNNPTGYHKGKFRDRTPKEQHKHAEELWKIYTQGYDDEPCESSFDEVDHGDQPCEGRKPIAR